MKSRRSSTGRVMRHGDGLLAPGRRHRQAGEAEVQEQVADVRLAGRERMWLATRLPLWNSSTVRAVMRAHSFAERHELEAAVSTHVARAAEKLRRQRLVAGAVMVFVTTNPFRPQDRHYAALRTIGLPVSEPGSAVHAVSDFPAGRAKTRETMPQCPVDPRSRR